MLYGRPEDPDAFERYYAQTHTALATAIPGLQRFEAAQGIATPDGGAVPYQRIAELTFEDMAALQAGVAEVVRRHGLPAPRSQAALSPRPALIRSQ